MAEIGTQTVPPRKVKMEIVCESPKIVKQPSMLRKFVIPEESFENLSEDSKEEECILMKNVRLRPD